VRVGIRCSAASDLFDGVRPPRADSSLSLHGPHPRFGRRCCSTLGIPSSRRAHSCEALMWWAFAGATADTTLALQCNAAWHARRHIPPMGVLPGHRRACADHWIDQSGYESI
jgi:hypothetical protein